MIVLTQGEGSGDDTVDGDHPAARPEVDGPREHDVSELETIAVVTVEIKRAVAAAAGGVSPGMTDGDRRQHDDPVLVARGFRTGDEDAVGIVIAARGGDAGVGERERGNAIEPELQAAGAVAVGVEVDRAGGQAGGADVPEHESPFGDEGATVVKVVGVEDERPALTLAEVLGARAAGADHAVDGDEAVRRGVRVIVADVEIQVARRPQVG